MSKLWIISCCLININKIFINNLLRAINRTQQQVSAVAKVKYSEPKNTQGCGRAPPEFGLQSEHFRKVEQSLTRIGIRRHLRVTVGICGENWGRVPQLRGTSCGEGGDGGSLGILIVRLFSKRRLRPDRVQCHRSTKSYRLYWSPYGTLFRSAMPLLLVSGQIAAIYVGNYRINLATTTYAHETSVEHGKRWNQYVR